MQSTSQYKIFVSNKCCCCGKILDYLEKENKQISTINIDNDKYYLPFSLLILPALVKEKKLISYGADDIIKHLNTI
jgi:hypothetical protein